jgi:hypothetical protein
MKKFGTPIGAGPGNAKLNVGFEAVGTPPAPVGGAGLDGFFGLAGCFVAGVVDGPAFVCREDAGLCFCWEEGCCFLLVRWGRGALCDGAVVEPVEVVPGVVLVAAVVVGVDEQFSETACTGPVTGSLIDDSGVPGGTFTVKSIF